MDGIIKAIIRAYQTENKILICGNGGLAAESEHFAAEMVGKFGTDVFLPCISLCSNSSILTALSNDYGYENVFAHQIKVLGKSGDILIAMTTSASPNILKALKQAKEMGLITICLCGFKDIEADFVLKAKTMNNVATIQEDILFQLHYIANSVKRGI